MKFLNNKILLLIIILIAFFMSSCNDYCLSLYGNPYCELNQDENDDKSVFYVNCIKGNDYNSGTKTKPFKSITAAIKYASSLFESADIYVSEGEYNVNYLNDTHIKMVEGISLYGGYANDNWDLRDPQKHITSIVDNNIVSDSKTVVISTNITNKTVIDGFMIKGGGKRNSYAVYINDASPVISNCVIKAGSSENNYAVYNIYSKASIYDNVILGGYKGTRSYGIYNKNSELTITNNDVWGGNGESGSYAIYNIYSSIDIIDNIKIDGGNSKTETFAVYSEDSVVNIKRNNIYANDSFDNIVSAYGVYSYNTQTEVYNNYIYGRLNYALTNTIYGVYLINDYNNRDIHNKIINNSIGCGHTRTISFAVYCGDFCGADIINNCILGGVAYEHEISGGIQLNNCGEVNIINNTIIGTPVRHLNFLGVPNAGVRFSGGTTDSLVSICNNIIGCFFLYICEDDISSDPFMIENNHFWKYSGVGYLDEGYINVQFDINGLVVDNTPYFNDTIVESQSEVSPENETIGFADGLAINNFTELLNEDFQSSVEDVEVLNTNDWSLTEATPTNILYSALDFSAYEYFPKNENDDPIDKIETVRTIEDGWSKGAYEY